MKIVMKPYCKRCLCVKCGCEFVIEGKDWQKVKTISEGQLELIPGITQMQIKPYETDVVLCPMCQHVVVIKKREM